MTALSVHGIDGMDRVLGALMGEATAPGMARAVAADDARRRQDDYVALVDDCGLRALARHLPCDSAARIARAPLFAGLVRMRDDAVYAGDRVPAETERALLCGWMEAELTLLGERQPRAEMLWTALGDAAFAPSQPAYYAPTLWGVVVDTASPYVTEAPFLPPPMRARARGRTDPAAALAALRGALDVLADAHQPSADFTALSLASFALYDTPDNAESFSSSSSRSFPGAAALSNVAGLGMDRFRLADSVLHEAVHAFLYAVEGAVPFFRPGSRHEPPVRSPWTGVILPLHAFVHACFVWLTLLAFWRQARARMESQDGPDNGRVAELMERAGVGFRSPALKEAIHRVRDRITPEAEASLHRVRFLAGTLA